MAGEGAGAKNRGSGGDQTYRFGRRNYLCLATCKAGVIDAAVKLGVETRNGGSGAGWKWAWFGDGSHPKSEFLAVINDRGDFEEGELAGSIERGEWPPAGCDSLVSYAHMGTGSFRAGADYWAISTHYYFWDGETFAASNNPFVVARLLGLKLSVESLWEYLFFLAPLKERSWFKGLHRLQPGQTVAFAPERGAPVVSAPLALRERLVGHRATMDDVLAEVRAFMADVSRRMKGRVAALSLSAGSDSRTVLAWIRGSGIRVEARSFGLEKLRETQLIREFTRNYSIPWVMVSMYETREEWRQRHVGGARVTGGLLNPFRTHYHALYRASPPDQVVFEGILGSEFVKGVERVGAMIGKPHLDVIQGKGNVAEVIERRMGHLAPGVRSAMADYIQSVHTEMLVDINTPEGYATYLDFALEFVPSRCFAGMILLAGREHDCVYPFLSPRVLCAVFGSGGGVANHVDLRSDYPPYEEYMRHHAATVRHMDPELYKSRLDTNVSFAEIEGRPRVLYKGIRKVRSALAHWKWRNFSLGQVDVSEKVGYAREFIREVSLPVEVEAVLGASPEATNVKEASNLAALQLCAEMPVEELLS